MCPPTECLVRVVCRPGAAYCGVQAGSEFKIGDSGTRAVLFTRSVTALRSCVPVSSFPVSMALRRPMFPGWNT